MSFKQCHWGGILNWIKLNVSKVKWTNSTLTVLWNLGDRKKKKKKKKNLTSNFYDFSTICKYVSFSKTTMHPPSIANISLLFQKCGLFFIWNPSQTVVTLVNKQEKKQQQNFCQIKSFVSLLCFNLRIALANFTADEPSTSLLDDFSSSTLPSFNSWSFFIFISSSLLYSQWYHAWESISPAIHSVICDIDWVSSHVLFP